MGFLLRLSIAFPVRSVDRSLFIPLILRCQDPYRARISIAGDFLSHSLSVRLIAIHSLDLFAPLILSSRLISVDHSLDP